ncbi:MAG: TRAP transporter small permease [Clostridiales bacterium]|nr:TRAP transporter small permease [Clostridiales bacterium]
MLKKIDKGISYVENTMLVFGILSATFVLFANVIMRYFLKSGLVWAEEYARFAIIWIVCGGCGAAVRRDEHMKITAIPDAIHNRIVKDILLLFVEIVCLIFSILMLTAGARLIRSMMTNNQLSPAMEIPLWWIYLSMPVGGVVMTFRFLLQIINTVRELVKGGEKA